MPIQRSTAKKLVSESEFKLINESFPPLVGSLSDKALLQRMERTRKARDRYHTMVERQRSKAPSGAQRGAASSANQKDVVSKEKIFEETLARFERQTAKAGGSAGPQAATPMKSASKPAAKAAMPAKGTAAKSGKQTKQTSAGKAKAAAAKSSGMKAGVNTPAQSVMGKKTGVAKSGAQATSKASVKMANKAAAKTGTKAGATKAAATKAAGAKAGAAKAGAAKAAATKAGKGKGGATKRTPRGRHGAMVASTTLH